MPFVDVQLSDVEIEKPSAVPVGKYTFKLQPGSKIRVNEKSGIEELNVRFDVTEGEYAGRPVFVNYPDPTAIQKAGKNAGKPMSFSAQALKKLEIALGEDSLPGENPLTYLNRVATSGHAVLSASVIDASYVKDGVKVEQVKFGIFTVGPAA